MKAKFFWSDGRAPLSTFSKELYGTVCMLFGRRSAHKQGDHNWSLISPQSAGNRPKMKPKMESTQNFSLGGPSSTIVIAYQTISSPATTRAMVVVVFRVVSRVGSCRPRDFRRSPAVDLVVSRDFCAWILPSRAVLPHKE